jgi:hypothetical protein
MELEEKPSTVLRQFCSLVHFFFQFQLNGEVVPKKAKNIFSLIKKRDKKNNYQSKGKFELKQIFIWGTSYSCCWHMICHPYILIE